MASYLYPDQLVLNSQCNTNISFAGFVDAILHADIRNDIHWDTQYETCNPCRFKFDFIGKLENLSEEQSYVINYIFKEDLVLPTRNTSPKKNNEASRQKKKYSHEGCKVKKGYNHKGCMVKEGYSHEGCKVKEEYARDGWMDNK